MEMTLWDRSLVRRGPLAATVIALSAVTCLLAPSPASADTIFNDNGATSARDAARNAAVAAARGDLNRATSQLTAATERVRATWKAAPDMATAGNDLAAARKDYQAARAAVIERLKTDPAYQAALKEQTDAQAALHDEQRQTNAAQPATTRPAGSTESVANLPAPSSAQVEVASQKLEAKTKLRNVEDTAVSNDANASKAQAKLNVAEQKSKALQLQLDAAIKSDPDVRAAEDQVQAAHARITQAAAANY